MAANFVLTHEAVDDADEAYGWYENQRVGLGEEFLGCLESTFEQIRRNPEWSPAVHRQYRRTLVRRFPYAVFYELSGDGITVFAVFHTARDPKKWRKRLRE
jgi:plasmid stabilization system protein ParE